MRLVLIPGWNEGARDMQVFVDGRHGRPGLAAKGFSCAIYDGGKGSLTDRIDQLAQFLAGLRAASDPEEPIALFGYSAGAIVARGLLRSGSTDARIAGLFQLGAPNAGIATDDLAGLLHRLHFSKSTIADLDFSSDFMRWLNGTSGHWEEHDGVKRWRLDRKPWVSGEGVPILSLVGRAPQYNYSGDGVVLTDSATLEGHVPHAFVDDRRANHLNLSGAWNPLTLLLRRWLWDDRLWPRVVDAAAAFFAASLPHGT
jgi:hypothetical protein